MGDKNPVAVEIDGATGPHANKINGLYRPMKETPNSPLIYKKGRDQRTMVEYDTDRDLWVLSTSGFYNKSQELMRSTPAKDLPLVSRFFEMRMVDEVGVWHAQDINGNWPEQESVIIEAEGALHRTEIHLMFCELLNCNPTHREM